MPPRKSVRRSLRKQKHSKRRTMRKTNRKTMGRQSRMRKTNRKTMRRKNKYRKSLRGGVVPRPLPIPPPKLNEGIIKEDIIRIGVGQNALYTTYDYLERENQDLYDKLLSHSDKEQDPISQKNKEYFSKIRKEIEKTIKSVKGVETSRKNFAKTNFSNCLLKSSGPFLTKNDAIKLFDLIDKDGDRSITTEELLSIYAPGPEDKQQIRGIKSRIEGIERGSGMETNGQIEIYEFITYLINKTKIIQEGENEIFKPQKLEELSNPDFAMAKKRELIKEVFEQEEEEEEEEEEEGEDGAGVPARPITPPPRAAHTDGGEAAAADKEEAERVAAEKAAADKAAAEARQQVAERDARLSAADKRMAEQKAVADKAAADKEEQEKLLKLILKQHALIEETFNRVKL